MSRGIMVADWPQPFNQMARLAWPTDATILRHMPLSLAPTALLPTPTTRDHATQPPVLIWQLGLRTASVAALAQAADACQAVARVAGRDPALAVHQLRREIRRLRALVRLLSPALGVRAARSLRLSLRREGAQLAELRDAAVLPTALGHLPIARQAQLAPLQADLSQRCAKLYADPALPEQLQATADRISAQLAPMMEPSSQWYQGLARAHLRAGLARLLRRWRRARKQALRTHRDRDVHQLRKQSKEVRDALLWLHLGGRRARRLHAHMAELADQLGHVTDLIALRPWLRQTPAMAELRAQLRIRRENALQLAVAIDVARPQRQARKLLRRAMDVAVADPPS